MRSVQTLDHFCATFYGNLFILFSVVLMNNRCSLSLPHFSLLALPFPIPFRCACGYEVGGYVCVCVQSACVYTRGRGFVVLCRRVFPECGVWDMLWLHTNGTHTRPFFFFWHTQSDTHTRASTHTVKSHPFFFCRISTHKSAPSLKQRA